MGETIHRICSDPIERIIQEALDDAGIAYTLEDERHGQTLDFHLTDFNVLIECKQFHSPRIADQMSRAPNIIAIQGRKAAEFFATRLTTDERIG